MPETLQRPDVPPETTTPSPALSVQLKSLRKIYNSLLAGILLSILPTAHAADIVEPMPMPAATVTPRTGSLIIVGGGQLSEEIDNRFLELSGGENADIVVIPTASMVADTPEGSDVSPYWNRWKGADSIRILHTRDRAVATTADFSEPLREAKGVWLGGGDQGRLAEAYQGTPVEEELKKLLARGGVIGGTSAGASIMSKLMIAKGYPVAELGVGFDLLSGAVIDQHFTKRNRGKRLEHIAESHPDYYGIGVDEETALIVNGTRAEILGKAHVWFYVSSDGVLIEDTYENGNTIDLEKYRARVVRTAQR